MKINLNMKHSASVLFAATVLVGASSSAHGWVVDTSATDLDSALTFTANNGSFSRTTLKEGVRADTTTSGGIPINNTFQNWDGSNWPSANFSDMASVGGATADSAIAHDGTSDEFFDSAEASIDGNLPPDGGAGSNWLYDFELVIDAGASVTVDLNGAQTNVYAESESGDDGNAFAGIELYSFDVGINDPGGSNNPYAEDDIFVSAPPSGQVEDRPLTFSHTFDNTSGNSPQTLNLRLRGSSAVFEAVPEPTSLALLGLGSLAMLRRRRRHAS